LRLVGSKATIKPSGQIAVRLLAQPLDFILCCVKLMSRLADYYYFA